MRRFSNVVTAAGALLLCLTGCATQAQRQAQAISTKVHTATDALSACINAVYASEDNAPLRPHYPLKPGDATLQQMTETSYINEAEVSAIYDVNPKYHECRKEFILQVSSAIPTIVPIFVESESNGDRLLISLIEKKLTWGAFADKRKDLGVKTERLISVESKNIEKQLEQSHEAELARRQAAFTALANYAQTQSLIEAANRPIVTSCTGDGYSSSCVSR